MGRKTLCFFFFNFLFCSGVKHTVMVVSGEQWSLSHTYTCIHSSPNTPPTRLPHYTEQSSMCYTVGPCRLFILYIAVCTYPSPEKAMAPNSSTLARKTPWMEEPVRLQSMGSRRVGHDWVTSLSLFTFLHWRRKWQPTPVFLPGESQGRGSLVGCRLWGRAESNTTEVT